MRNVERKKINGYGKNDRSVAWTPIGIQRGSKNSEAIDGV
jgi:hypothetical protein